MINNTLFWLYSLNTRVNNTLKGDYFEFNVHSILPSQQCTSTRQDTNHFGNGHTPQTYKIRIFLFNEG